MFQDYLQIIKYSSLGIAQWVKNIPALTWSISIDNNGNVYAAGYTGSGVVNFGDGVIGIGTYIFENPIFIKYNSSGTTQWARSTTSGNIGAGFNSVAIDTNGNVYAVGGGGGDVLRGTFSFGNGVTVTSSGLLLVKYGE
ncbi:MAG: hypothetical protein FWD47_01205 [Treponema sp.]|nr:hypothetical protein [Treponema sp.]